MARLSALARPGIDDTPRLRERAWALAVLAGGSALVAAVVATHSASGGLAPSARPLLGFDAAKVPAFARALGVLAALDLAAWFAGGLVRRLLRVERSAGAVLEGVRRLALGFLALADLVLLLAALHLLRRALLMVLLFWLAVAGLVQLVRARRVVGPPSRPLRDAVSIAVMAAALLAGATAALGAHMPDYGWDAFTYHLALPERYLFEDRIVVSPLFPHSAFPLTVEMLYALALAADPGPAAKLLHAEMGALVALAAACLAGRHSRRAGLLAALVLLADPLFNWELGVAYTDLGAALFAVLALASLQDALDAEPGRRRAALRLCGVFAGACLATRYTAAAVPVALALVLLWTTRPLRQAVRDVAVVAALAALVLSPWLVRNAVFTGNPVAPALQSLFYEPGHEYFDAQAMRQQLAFVRLVGFGRGLGDLVALPVNLTVRARAGLYQAFGFRAGPMYVAGLAAAVALASARRSRALRAVLPVAAVMTLAWFYTSQEPRYLVPTLAVMAVACGIGWDALVSACARLPRPVSAAAVAVPLVALAHTQMATLARLPFVYGYALGPLSVPAFRAQDPALTIADRLRATLGPRDRLLLVYEPRGFLFHDLRYVFAHYFELMQLVHRAGDADTLAAELRGLGVTHVLVNTPNVARYRTISVPGYGEADLDRDLQTLGALLERHSVLVMADRGVFVRRMDWADTEESRWER